MPAATSEAKTRTRTIATTGSDTSSAFWRSFSDCSAESLVIGAVAGELVGVAGRRHDRRPDVVDASTDASSVMVELDDDVGRVAGGADEARVLVCA